ncbi:hypothetical protein DL768_006966 [Monosporascus sp. mg162]|nr:hypothetical protein DL768_006966 [Monosporascus sp. mg162]
MTNVAPRNAEGVAVSRNLNSSEAAGMTPRNLAHHAGEHYDFSSASSTASEAASGSEISVVTGMTKMVKEQVIPLRSTTHDLLPTLTSSMALPSATGCDCDSMYSDKEGFPRLIFCIRQCMYDYDLMDTGGGEEDGNVVQRRDLKIRPIMSKSSSIGQPHPSESGSASRDPTHNRYWSLRR